MKFTNTDQLKSMNPSAQERWLWLSDQLLFQTRPRQHRGTTDRLLVFGYTEGIDKMRTEMFLMKQNSRLLALVSFALVVTLDFIIWISQLMYFVATGVTLNAWGVILISPLL